MVDDGKRGRGNNRTCEKQNFLIWTRDPDDVSREKEQVVIGVVQRGKLMVAWGWGTYFLIFLARSSIK